MTDIIAALDQLEKERNIDKNEIMDAIVKSINSACENDFLEDETHIHHVEMNRETGEIKVFAHKLVVEEIVTSKVSEITLKDAQAINPEYQLDDLVPVEVATNEFGRIAAQKARSIIVQAIKESEKAALYNYFKEKEKNIITGVVKGYTSNGKNLIVSLDEKTETVLSENESIPEEVYKKGDRIKLYIYDVIDPSQDEKDNPDKKDSKGKKDRKDKRDNKKNNIKIKVSRRRSELVQKLFEQEVEEIRSGIVEIKSISRDIKPISTDKDAAQLSNLSKEDADKIAGPRTKIAVWSNDSKIDPVGSCVGRNGDRVNRIVEDLHGEKIDIIKWDEDPGQFIMNALSPAVVMSVSVNVEEKKAMVIVADKQLSLAIGKEGQNARLAAKLTGYNIDIKSVSKARELGYIDNDELDYYIDDADEANDTEE